jgi:16S rRNA (cytosine967-C5)-methyltransferase
LTLVEAVPKARDAAVKALCRIERDKAYANLVLSIILDNPSLNPQDRGFATELTYGTLRHKGRIDWILNQFLSQPLEAQLLFIRNLLRITVYQLLFLPNIPQAVVCSESVKICKRNVKTRHLVPLVNALCRKMTRMIPSLEYPSFQDDPLLAITVNTSHPEWIIRRWIDQYGIDKAKSLAEANNQPAPLVIRVNRLKIDQKNLVDQLTVKGVKVFLSPIVPSALRVEGLKVGACELFQAGYYSVQDESSQLVGFIVDPRPNELIYDLCAAPGSKSTHLAELSDDTASIAAFDLHSNRLNLVKQAAARLDIKNITVNQMDATDPKPGLPLADKVLVDAPCSGLGVLRRRVDLRWKRTPYELKGLIQLQRSILAQAVGMLKPGGLLVYSTCSVDREENLDNFTWLKNEFGLQPLDFSNRLPSVFKVEQHLDEVVNGYLQLCPDTDDTDGFFISCLTHSS